MSQHVIDFSDDPSGVQLLDDKLTPMKQNILTQNSGNSRPSYATSGTEWLDVTTTPWVKKLFDGTDDIVLGTVNPTTNIFTPFGQRLDKLDATSAPTVNDDSVDGYSVGSVWINVSADDPYIAVDVSAGAAVWRKLRHDTTAYLPTAGGTLTGDLTVPSINGGQIGGFRNALYNGAFGLWQRATTSALTTSLAVNAADRWRAYMNVSAAGIFNRDNSVPSGAGFQYSAKLGRNSGSSLTGEIAALQVLETADSLRLAGKQVTLSYYARAGSNFSGASSLMTASLFTGTGTDQSGANPAGWTGITNNISQAVTLTTSWQRFQHTVTLGSISQAGVKFHYNGVGTAGADDNIYITGVQLEIGSVATPFEFRDFSTELAACQRYYEKSFAYSTAPAQNAGTGNLSTFGQVVGASTGMHAHVQSFMVEKRTSPTMTFYNPSAANAQCRNFTTASDCSSTTTSNITTKSVSVQFTTSAASSAGHQLGVHWAADSEL